MNIGSVIVCVNYADFLCWALPTNRSLFDKTVVVTTTKDRATQKLCEYWHVQCIQTDVCYEGGASFNKGKMINVGLKELDNDWVVHMDADIFLPPLFRKIVSSLKLDPQSLYHIDRVMVTDFGRWLDFYMDPSLQHEADIYVHPGPFPLGVRLAKESYGGWLPLGFFQMWNQKEKKLAYPEEHGDAGRSDLLFSLKFPRDKRAMLPEIIGVHLETKAQAGGMGANWGGRKTPPFGPILAELYEPDKAPDGVNPPEGSTALGFSCLNNRPRPGGDDVGLCSYQPQPPHR